MLLSSKRLYATQLNSTTFNVQTRFDAEMVHERGKKARKKARKWTLNVNHVN